MAKIMYNDNSYGEFMLGTPFIGTDGTTPGTSGLVPAPTASDRNKFLKSDGTWAVGGGSGGGGTGDYEELANLPSINNHELFGSMTFNQLGLIDFFYPVGSYYHTSNANFDPNTVWGGTWIQLGEGQVLLSAGNTYTAGTEYGNNSISYTPSGSIGNTTLTAAQSGNQAQTITTSQHNNHTHAVSGNTADGGSHSHTMQSVWSNGSGSQEAYTMTNNRVRMSRSTDTGGSHHHSISFTSGGGGQHTHSVTVAAKNATSGHNHSWTGTGATLNIMQKSTATYIWHRTA